MRSAGTRSAGRAADDAADVAADLLELGRAQIRAKAGDRFELVERAAGRAEAAAGDHRHLQVAAGQQRRERQRNLVADAAGRVLVDLRRFAGRPLERDAGVEHVLGERGDFGDRHAAQVDGHRPGRHLVVGHVAADVAGDERADFVFGQLAAVALFRDEADDVHSEKDADDAGCSRKARRHKDKTTDFCILYSACLLCVNCSSANSSPMIPVTIACSLSRAVSAVAMTSWPLVVTCLSGEQMLVIVERPSTRRPAWMATIASGTVDMPTASASK